jgi:hypothetical protein
MMINYMFCMAAQSSFFEGGGGATTNTPSKQARSELWPFFNTPLLWWKGVLWPTHQANKHAANSDHVTTHLFCDEGGVYDYSVESPKHVARQVFGLFEVVPTRQV